MEYTRGEWKDEGTIIVAWRKGKQGDGYVLCQMANPFPKNGMVNFEPLDIANPEFRQQMANAHLISAAPELYGALKEMFGQMPKHKNPELAQKVARALAKAEGKSSS